MSTGHRGLLVTFDGPAGAGKSTAVRLTARYLEDRGLATHTTAEPSQQVLGTIARNNTDTFRGLSLACLVAADRYRHLETELRPYKRAGGIVLCDRYVASSLVLQRMDGVPLDFLVGLNAHADLPDLAVLLTVEPSVAVERVAVRGAHTRFHQGIASAEQEVAFYEEAATWLTSRGVPLLTVDTTDAAESEVAAHIGARITRLAATAGTRAAEA
ncbi:dTMP kinase [Actinokineospora sp. PR83]|uniref:dTMP kinase n=1 Tax=Actinokineospora sp. PR83 TaxID=2884908 RepID=UPI0027E140E0|nr:dTMP kinase [Actinokineospora sp. PR83]MCG8915722.1 dTMP kinase [Actinokineospora sp. PR83]